MCKSAPHSRQITMPAPHHSSFLQAGCPSCRPTNSVKALKAPQRQTHATQSPESSKQTTEPLASTRKIKPIWTLLKQETVSGSGISWAVCKSAPHSRQTTTPTPHHSVCYRPDAVPAAQPTASKH